MVSIQTLYRSRIHLLAGSALGSIFILAGASAVAQQAVQLPTLSVEGAGTSYKAENPSISKLTEPLVDTPQTINTVTEQVLKDRGATTLNDAFRNMPGITIGAGEFRSEGNSPTIRGFVARSDMFLDGMRDFGSYYRDPFGLEEVQVLEGPSSILFGRGSTGGVINQVTKLPKLTEFYDGTVTFGTDATKRVTVDLNAPLPDLAEGAALRLVAMGHDADVTGRDVVHQNRYGFAPSFSLGLGTPTRLTFSYYHLSSDDVPDYGLPYLGALPAPVAQNNFYGFKSDFMKTDVDIATFKAEHDFSDNITAQNILRFANYARDLRFSEPLTTATLPTSTPPQSVVVTRNVETGSSGGDTMLWDQASVTAHFATGEVQHALVLGGEGGHETASPEFYNSAGVPTTSLLSPNESQAFAGVTFPRYKTHSEADSLGLFAMDTLKFGAWEVSGGIRWDYFDIDYHDRNYSTTPATYGTVTRQDHLTRTDEKPSYRASLVYKPDDNGSVYFTYGTSFNPSAEDLSFVVSSRNFNLSNTGLSPELNTSYEVGTKWDLFSNTLSLTASLFRLEKENARIPDPTNTLLNILGGDQRVDGMELGATGHITPEWQVTAGYAYLHSVQTKSGPGAAPVGSVLMNTPKHSLTFWSTYELPFGLEIGGGGRYVSAQVTQPVPPVKSVPSYWAFDAMAKYKINDNFSAQVNIINLTDKYYYDQLHFFHVVPGEGRTALFSLNVTY